MSASFSIWRKYLQEKFFTHLQPAAAVVQRIVPEDIRKKLEMTTRNP
jgi:hypothetical protein